VVKLRPTKMGPFTVVHEADGSRFRASPSRKHAKYPHNNQVNPHEIAEQVRNSKYQNAGHDRQYRLNPPSPHWRCLLLMQGVAAASDISFTRWPSAIESQPRPSNAGSCEHGPPPPMLLDYIQTDRFDDCQSGFTLQRPRQPYAGRASIRKRRASTYAALARVDQPRQSRLRVVRGWIYASAALPVRRRARTQVVAQAARQEPEAPGVPKLDVAGPSPNAVPAGR